VTASRLARRATVAAPAGADPLTRIAIADPRWTEFVASSAAATPFHMPAWAGLLAEAYAFDGFALALTGPRGEIVAGAPFLEVRSLSRRRSWIALPFTDALAPLATDAAAAREYEERLGQTQAALAAPRLELRDAVGALGWERSACAVTHALELDRDLGAVHKRFSKSQVVRNIRRAEREGVTVRAARTPADVDAFYALHLRTRRRQGVPVQPRRFFDLIWERLVVPGHGTLMLADHGATALAGALFLSWNGTTIYKFGASDPAGLQKRPNHLIFATAIADAVARGDRAFDFGRTDLDNAGLRAFKSAWGGVERPLVYSSLVPGASEGRAGAAGRALASTIQRGPEWLCRGLGEALYRYAASR
jgi:CelD/BcsL family acetyltransferase involved in cellulose biosynthesis